MACTPSNEIGKHPPECVPVVAVSPFGNHPYAAPVQHPDSYAGSLDDHVEYMEKHWDETARLLNRVGKGYGADDAYFCTFEAKLGFGITNPASGRFIHAMEFAADDKIPPIEAVVTFTENNGFRIAGMNENEELVDLGPVTNPMLVGPKSHPQALLVPLANVNAAAKATDMLNGFIINSISDIPEEESSKNIAAEKMNCVTRLPE